MKLWFNTNPPPSDKWVWRKSYEEARVFLSAVDWDIEVFSIGDLPHARELATHILMRQADYQNYKPLVGVTSADPSVLGVAAVVNKRSMKKTK